MQAQFLSIPEAARALSVGRSTLYRLLEGELPSVRIRGRRLISVADLQEYVEKLRAGTLPALDREAEASAPAASASL